jgi:cation:H+ antiporter
MLLLGSITSLPEIANVTTSSWTGNPSLAINNLLGSASINVLLLAIADSFIGRDALTSLVAQPATLMQATLSMIVMALVAIGITDFFMGNSRPWTSGPLHQHATGTPSLEEMNSMIARM